MFHTPTKQQHLFSFSTTIIGDDFDVSNTDIEIVDLSSWEYENKFCVVIHGVLTPQECVDIISMTESVGYEPALVNIGGGRQMLMPDVRNNDRCIIDDSPGAEKIWQRILKVLDNLPEDKSNVASVLTVPWYFEAPLRAVGINERLRFLRYDEGTYFAPHYDGQYVRGNELGKAHAGEKSFVTFQLYLNEGFEGGATRFQHRLHSNVGYDVIPRTGSVLLFQHDCFHEGSVLVRGRKYCVRSDVMYSSEASWGTEEET